MCKIFLFYNTRLIYCLTGFLFGLGNPIFGQSLAHDVIENAEASLTPIFNNVPLETYRALSTLSGNKKTIQTKTKGIWPRQKDGRAYSIGPNRIRIERDDKYLRIKTNNIPDHSLYTNNPNCAREQNYSFKIPLEPELLKDPIKITPSMQSLGVAINGVVIAGPYDSQNKIAPYNRQIDQCGSHSDPQGMYHYHFAPLCLIDKTGEKIALKLSSQIGWAFDGIRIFGLADRYKHLPELDDCNGHEHENEYHYHATIDYPFFMGCFKARPVWSNQGQKVRQSASCPSNLVREKRTKRGERGGGRGKRPAFRKASKILGKSVREIKDAIGPPPPPNDFSKAGEILGVDAVRLERLLFPDGR